MIFLYLLRLSKAKRHQQELLGDNGINAILLLFCLGFSAWGGLNIHALDWLILIILGLSSGLFYVFWYFGCQKVDGVMASLTTVIIAWMRLGEQLTISQTVGMGMVLFSIAAYAKR